eukprot:6196109-Pleurochrysis_carterae.AAC.1
MLAQVIIEDFDRATHYAQQFEEYRVMHVFGEHWNFDAYAAMQFAASFKDTVTNFKRDMAQLNKWYRDLDRMKMFGFERNLHIDSKTLKNTLLPVTQRALDRCRTLLLQAKASTRTHALRACRASARAHACGDAVRAF